MPKKYFFDDLGVDGKLAVTDGSSYEWVEPQILSFPSEKLVRLELAVGDGNGEDEKTNPGFGDDRRGAWERLDRSQRQIVRDLNPEYRKKKWLTAEDIAIAGLAMLQRTTGVHSLRTRRGDGQ